MQVTPRQHMDTVMQVALHGHETASSRHELLIRDSWQRCVHQHRLDPTRMQEAVILPQARLREHKDQMEALLQIAATTASDTWVDEHGGYYGIPRRNGEADAPYAARMVAEITSARGNGVAIAEAIRLATTGISAKVTDYATITVSGGGVGSYGLFDADVEVGVDSPLDQVQINSNTLSTMDKARSTSPPKSA